MEFIATNNTSKVAEISAQLLFEFRMVNIIYIYLFDKTFL